MKHRVVPHDRDEATNAATLRPRERRALDKADTLLARITTLRHLLADVDLDETTREQSLVAIEALVLTSRGSSEVDHRKQLVLAGLADAADAYLVDGAPLATSYASSADPDRLLADRALEALRAEYEEDAALFTNADVAAAVRRWAVEHV
ncbi:MAG: hypothetical protein ABI321_08550 [Polyangia bacterium]